MSKVGNIGDNPNDKLPSGEPLEHDEIALGSSDHSDASDNGKGDDGGLGPVNEDENDPGVPLQGNPDNSAGTDSVDRDKFERDPAEGDDTGEERRER